MTRAETLLQRALEKGAVIATVESCTGGLIAGAITDVPGSSSILDRGFVTYSNAAKMEMVGVRAETLDAHGAVSEEVALEMAAGAIENAPVTHAISVTGLAGPGGSAFKPEGRVCFGLAIKGEPTKTLLMDFGAIGRENVRQATVDLALDLLIEALS